MAIRRCDTKRDLVTAPRRVIRALGLLIGALVFTAACASSTTSTPAPTAAGGSGAPGGSSAGSTPSAVATQAASAHAVGASACITRYLHGGVGQRQGAMGSTYVNIVFKNLGTAPCTLYGYPGVSLGAGTPVNQVGQPADRDHAVPSKVITLQPGGYAYATLRITDALNYPEPTCKPVPTTWLLVYPPNTSNLIYIPYSTNACTGNVVTLTVQAVQAGDGG